MSFENLFRTRGAGEIGTVYLLARYRASSSLALKFQLLTSRSCFGNEGACIVVLIIHYWPDIVIEKHYKTAILFDYFPPLMEMVAFYFVGMPIKRAF